MPIKKILNSLILSALIIGLFLPALSALGQTPEQLNLLRIVSLRVSPSDDEATIYWSTNYETTGIIQYGLTNAFSNWLGDNELNTYHETVISGLTTEETYYFRLTVSTADGKTVVSDIYDFETLEEDDDTAPAVTDVHTSFVTGNTATFVWETDENANSCVALGTSKDDLNKKSCDGSRVKIHDITVKNLKRNTLYYYNVYSKDKSGNTQYSLIYNFQTNFEDDEDVPDLIIYEITPFNKRSSEGTNSVYLTLNTNRPIEGYIRLGEKTGSYNIKKYLDAPRDTSTEIKLEDLEDDKVYYYRLYLKDVLGKKLDTPEFTFATLPNNVLTEGGQTNLPNEELFNINNPNQDFDQDGLTNAQEEFYNTDPIKSDTDGDGYVDGVEVAHGYNPLGPGKLNEEETTLSQENTKPAFAYSQPRLSSLQAEKNLALELREKLEQYFNSQIPKSTQHWYTLVNAYIYGGYPIEAIAQAIKHSGKTVHPSIPWTAWRKTADYQNYINR